MVVVCHCLLNTNAKVMGLAQFPGCSEDLILGLVRSRVGIIQLPCPEMSYLGPKRWGMTKEQYDTPMYRKHCRKLLKGIVQDLLAYRSDGYRIERVIGVNGSPSCGVTKTCFGYRGGELDTSQDQHSNLRFQSGQGVMMEVFQELLEQVGLEIPLDSIEESAAE